MLLDALVRGAGIHRFPDLAAAEPPPKGVILGNVFTPETKCKIDVQMEGAKRARGVFGTSARKLMFSGFDPGPWRCENTTPVFRDACHGARTRYIRELPREIVLGTFYMKSQGSQDPRNQVRFV